MAAIDYKLVNCGNDFYEHLFSKVCSELEAGHKIKVYVDCIGHTRNNTVQEVYKEKIEEKYKDTVKVESENGGYSYTYTYQLIK